MHPWFTVQDLTIYKPKPTSKCAKPTHLFKQREKIQNGFRPIHTYMTTNVSSQSIPFKKLQNMRVRLENPKQFGCAPVISSEPSSTGQKTTLKKQKYPNPKFFKNVYTTLVSLKLKYSIDSLCVTVRNKNGWFRGTKTKRLFFMQLQAASVTLQEASLSSVVTISSSHYSQSERRRLQTFYTFKAVRKHQDHCSLIQLFGWSGYLAFYKILWIHF